MPKVKEAAENKEKGNVCMKEGRNTEAIIWYTQSLKCDSSNHLVYSNRSLAFLKEQQFYLAMEDAKTCIKLQPKWPKGYFRKGEIELKTGHYLTAMISYKQALTLDPSDEGIKSALQKATVELNKAQKAAAKQPWVFTILGALIGVLIVLSDEYLTETPTLSHFVFKIAFVGVCGTLAALAARGYRYVSENEKNSLLEPPPDLFGDMTDSGSTSASSKKTTTTTTRPTTTTRQRTTKNTTI